MGRRNVCRDLQAPDLRAIRGRRPIASCRDQAGAGIIGVEHINVGVRRIAARAAHAQGVRGRSRPVIAGPVAAVKDSIDRGEVRWRGARNRLRFGDRASLKNAGTVRRTGWRDQTQINHRNCAGAIQVGLVLDAGGAETDDSTGNICFRPNSRSLQPDSKAAVSDCRWWIAAAVNVARHLINKVTRLLDGIHLRFH